MRKLLTLTAIGYMAAGLLTGCSLGAAVVRQAPVPATPAAAPVDTRPDCAPGAEVVVWYTESTPCDLDGSQTLVLLGLPNEAACDQHGGRWVYEACEDVDY